MPTWCWSWPVRSRVSSPRESPQRQGIVEAAELLGQLLLQDVERQEDGPALKDGVSRDRIPSVHDPEMRHGRKSSSKRFDGHKAAVVVDTDSQLVTAVDILPGNAGDNTGVLELVEQSEENTGIAVEETIGGCGLWGWRDAAGLCRCWSDSNSQGAGSP